jgi:hypothetical protein
VRPAKLQMNGTISNKQTQLLGCADDIDIIGRSQGAKEPGESRLQIDASSDCANSCSRGIYHVLDPPGPAAWQRDMSVDQKGGKPTSCL